MTTIVTSQQDTVTKPKKFIKYPYRISKEVFDEFTSKMSDELHKKTYESWKNGVNLATGRRIIPTGQPYKKLSETFRIKQKVSDTANKLVTYMELEQIKDVHKYLEKTTKLFDSVDKRNVKIKQFNDDLLSPPSITCSDAASKRSVVFKRQHSETETTAVAAIGGGSLKKKPKLQTPSVPPVGLVGRQSAIDKLLIH